MPYQPAFYARHPTSNIRLSIGQLQFAEVEINTGNHYNPSTGVFTAPVSGAYFFSVSPQHWGGSSAGGYIDLYRNGGLVRGMRCEYANTASYESQSKTGVIYLNANDNVYFYCSQDVTWSDHTSISGYLIG
jgi:hypothetical protein